MPISVKAETKPQWKGQEPTHTSVKGEKQVWIHPLLLSEMKLKKKTPSSAAALLTQATQDLIFYKNIKKHMDFIKSKLVEHAQVCNLSNRQGLSADTYLKFDDVKGGEVSYSFQFPHLKKVRSKLYKNNIRCEKWLLFLGRASQYIQRKFTEALHSSKSIIDIKPFNGKLRVLYYFRLKDNQEMPIPEELLSIIHSIEPEIKEWIEAYDLE